jgi:hypothetical protein
MADVYVGAPDIVDGPCGTFTRQIWRPGGASMSKCSPSGDRDTAIQEFIVISIPR